jgi:transcriptional regulator with XRE-family HTH domain
MINTESFIKRLEIILDYYSLNASSFADKIGVQRSSMSHLLSGRNKPSLDFMLKILEVFPEVDLYWMLNGKGTFPKSEVVFDSKSSPSTPIQSNTISETKIEKSNELNPEKFSNLSHVLEENKFETISNSKIASTQKTDGEIDRIVIFYKNGTFKTYSPE